MWSTNSIFQHLKFSNLNLFIKIFGYTMVRCLRQNVLLKPIKNISHFEIRTKGKLDSSSIMYRLSFLIFIILDLKLTILTVSIDGGSFLVTD